MNPDELYDPTNAESIVEYATRLEHHSLREVIEDTSDGPRDDSAVELEDPHRRRGSFGDAVEELFFGIPNNSRSEADFPEAGLELKCTPIKKNARGELVAKERLVIGMIDYMGVVHEDFEHSHLLDKASDMLLVTYLYEPGKNPIDYEIESVARWGLPTDDMPQFKRDWETVVEKVRSGHAEEISGSDTLYLEACTKAANAEVRRRQPYSDVPAKPRAWAIKASYMTSVYHTNLERIPKTEEEKELGLLELVRNRFTAYFGKTESELAEYFELSKSKNLCARITNKILGVGEDSEIEEFQKAGIKPKTMRLLKSGRPKEAVSFPAFDYFELAELSFEDSDFFLDLKQRYLFVIYHEDEAGAFRLSDICFWQMPDADFDEAKRCYEQMQANVRDGRADISPKSSENRCCHVRPHGRDSRDTRDQPFGPPVVKKCFWLNQGYLQDEIARMLSEA